MSDRPCIRCEHPLSLEDGHLVYCSYCGAPQIFLSEELQAELADGVRAFKEQSAAMRSENAEGAAAADTLAPGRTPPAAANTRGGPQAWPIAMRYALLSGAVALGLGLLSLALPPVSFLLMLWVLCAPLLTVGYFQARAGFAATQDEATSFAARLGLFTGVLVALCSAVVFTLNLVLARFVLHDAAALDAQLAATFATQRAAVLARMGAEAKPTLDLFAVPEFRVGLLLTVLGISAMLYLLLSAVAGAVAGAMLRRRRA